MRIDSSIAVAPVYQRIIRGLLKDPEVNLVMVEDYKPGGYFAAETRYITQLTRDLTPSFIGNWEPVEGSVLGLASLVNILKGYHLPLFDIDLGMTNQDQVIQDVEMWVGEPLQWIKSSPTGLHAVGKELISWMRYQILLLNMPHIDQHFVDWTIARHYGTLRMTAGGRKPYQPTAIRR